VAPQEAGVNKGTQGSVHSAFYTRSCLATLRLLRARNEARRFVTRGEKQQRCFAI
jgi:hypothetical protein